MLKSKSKIWIWTLAAMLAAPSASYAVGRETLTDDVLNEVYGVEGGTGKIGIYLSRRVTVERNTVKSKSAAVEVNGEIQSVLKGKELKEIFAHDLRGKYIARQTELINYVHGESTYDSYGNYVSSTAEKVLRDVIYVSFDTNCTEIACSVGFARINPTSLDYSELMETYHDDEGRYYLAKVPAKAGYSDFRVFTKGPLRSLPRELQYDTTWSCKTPDVVYEQDCTRGGAGIYGYQGMFGRLHGVYLEVKSDELVDITKEKIKHEGW